MMNVKIHGMTEATQNLQQKVNEPQHNFQIFHFFRILVRRLIENSFTSPHDESAKNHSLNSQDEESLRTPLVPISHPNQSMLKKIKKIKT
jgi:hypothetical protein